MIRGRTQTHRNYLSKLKLSPTRAEVRNTSQEVALPSASAMAWTLTNASNGEMLWGKRDQQCREMASLTKMMTLIVACQMIKLDLVDLDCILRVSRKASRQTGTTANLRENDLLTLEDALHAMMLPSGNDAAYCLAENLGSVLVESSNTKSKSSYVDVFVKHMNRLASQLGLQQSKFCNPHGLSNKGNVSTARDLGRLAAYLLNDGIASVIVSCREYACIIARHGVERKITWRNTNVLLEEPGFTGLKTGNTPNAGPCLCASYKRDGIHLIVVLLQCRSVEHRWTEAKRLLSWASASVKSN
mmetsp:Transcript_30248/g.53531  ORF Transcript_30248/g.53531 Transcript_30248/m.53531 type:complete len:301 (-) Transcript_30248:77-979(-)